LYDLHNEKQTQNMWKNLYVVVIQLTTQNQLKDFIDRFCFWIPCQKLYKEGVFKCSHIKIHMPFWMNSKLTLKENK